MRVWAKHVRARSLKWGLACLPVVMLASSALADSKVHERIDAFIEAKLNGPLAPPASDFEFLRRVSLDLTGTIPSSAEARRFLDDVSSTKREELVDRLLRSPKYARRMQMFFDVMLMERRADKHVPREQWREYLRRSFADNKPYDQLVREILTSDGTEAVLRPAAKFFLDRNGDVNLLTRDVGRIFFGMDLQCAQCHDHPLIDDYTQEIYYSLNAFLNRSYVFEFKEFDYDFKSGTLTFPPGVTEQVILVGVKGDKLDESNETFHVNLVKATNAVIADVQGIGTIWDDDGDDNPRPSGPIKDEIADRQKAGSIAAQQMLPRLTINDWYLRERDGGTDGLPFTVTLSPASTLPVTVEFFTVDGTANDGKDKLVTIGEKAEGEVTFESVFIKPSEPQRGVPRLPDGLATDEPALATSRKYVVEPGPNARSVPKFSRRRVLADLATSGRSKAFNRNIVNRLWMMMMGRGLVHPVDLHHAENPASHAVLLDNFAEEFRRSSFDVKAFLRELALSRTYQRSTEPLKLKTLPEPAFVHRYAVGLLRPLSPEQLAWSVLQATGATAAPRSAAEKRLQADPKFNAILQADEVRRRQHTAILEQAVYDQLKSQMDRFTKEFSGSGIQEFQATMQQALFLSNGDSIAGFLKPGGGNLIERLLKLEHPGDVVEELYLGVLTRRPTSKEVQDVEDYLISRGEERLLALQEITWALLTSTEFRFNH